MAIRILLLAGLCAATANADIYRWDTGEVIPGTEGIEPGPGVQLDNVNLEYSDLSGRNLTGARFGSARLSHASFYRSNVTDADLTGAVVTGVEFSNSTLAKEQLYSTASYQEKNLSGIAFGRRQQTVVNNRTHLDASGWDFREQNLIGARFSHVILTDANFDGALVTAVDFGRDQNLFGLTEDQLASTSSYLTKDLRGIVLGGNISGWNLRGQNLTNSLLGGVMANADLSYATLINSVLGISSSINLTGANLKGAALLGFPDAAIFDSTTVYNQWTTFPFGFDPTANELSLSPSPRGDFTVDDLLDQNDVDLVADFLQFAEDLESQPLWFHALTDHRFDLNNDTLIDQEDIRVWAHDIKHTWLGDADLDGEFNSGDLVQALTTGKYESAAKDHVFGRLIDPAGWSEGDWNADNEFTSADLVVALADGGYEQGPRPVAVPEPAACLLFLSGLLIYSWRRVRRMLPVCIVLGSWLCGTQTTRADIYRWDTGEVIPGTEGFVLGPETELSSWKADAQNLRYGDFSGSVWESRDLSDSEFSGSWLDGARFINANLTNANFALSSLTHGLFYGQIGNDFRGSNLTNVNLAGANLSNAYFRLSKLTNADLTGAVVTGTDFNNTDLTLAQLYSTQNYQAKDLSGIGLSGINLSGSDFSGQNLTDTNLWAATLTNANLTAAVVIGTNFGDAPNIGLTKEQLYSTQSYQVKNLSGIGLGSNDLSGWNFRGQNLTNADLNSSTLTNADLTGANLSNADLAASRLNNAQFTSNTVYNQWTLFPPDFDPVAKGLTRITSPQGDFDANDKFDEIDIDWLQSKILGGSSLAVPYRLREDMFDLDADGDVTKRDVTVWVEGIKHTYFGDANVDGEFNSTDLVLVFQAGRYEVPTQRSRSNLIDPATWSTGDWDSDGEFTSADLIVALADGGYEAGPRPVAVPEPSAVSLILSGCLACRMRRRHTGSLPLCAALVWLFLNYLPTSHADIFRWDNGEVIPGTEDIILEPGVWLVDMRLDYADLTNADLANANLTNADLTSANLTNANLQGAVLRDAVLLNAIVTDSNLTAVKEFEAEQLYSTASYQARNLRGIEFGYNMLVGWDFTRQHFSGAVFGRFGGCGSLNNANFSGANLMNVQFWCASQLDSVTYDATTVYNQWTTFVSRGQGVSSQGQTPFVGFTYVTSPIGDFDADDDLDVDDVDEYIARRGFAGGDNGPLTTSQSMYQGV